MIFPTIFAGGKQYEHSELPAIPYNKI